MEATSNRAHGKQVLERYPMLKKYKLYIEPKDKYGWSTLSIEIANLEELTQLIDDLPVEEIIIGQDYKGSDKYYIEIYDDYRE